MALITRDGTAALVPEEAVREVQKGVASGGSKALAKMRKLQNFSRNSLRMPVLSALPTAYFVEQSKTTAAPGRKQTTSAAWANKYVEAAELAVIVPIGQDTLDDTDYDIWAEIKDPMVEAFGVAIDGAIVHGTNAPTQWPDDIVTLATAAGNVVTLGTGADLYDDLLAPGGVFSVVEDDGFMVREALGVTSLMADLRGLRDQNDQPIFLRNMQDAPNYTVAGVPIDFDETGALDEDAALLVAGDWKQLVWAWRQEITYTILKEAVIQDPGTGEIVYNLAQQDMVALRAVMRLGWQYPNPVNRKQPTAASRFALGVLAPEAGSGS